MAQARALKQREYNTDVIAHDSTPIKSNPLSHRNTNTFKSQALSLDPHKAKVLNSRVHEEIFR